MKTDYLYINNKLVLCCGDPRSKYESLPSLIIHRDVKAGSPVSQMFVPSRFLSGIIPTILLNQYKFWQNEDDSLIGYMPSLISNKSLSRSILNIDILRIGLRDSTGYCNSLADALISKVYVLENILTQSDSEKEFNTKPDLSKPTEYLVNLMAVLSHHVKKYNNTTNGVGPLPSGKELIEFKNETTSLHALIRLILRLDCLSNVLAWSKSDPNSTLNAPISIDVIELPRLRLTFEKRISSVTGHVQYVCIEQNGTYLTGYNDTLHFSDLLNGLPRAILLTNNDGEYFVVLPAIAKPVLTKGSGSGPASYNMVMSMTNKQWVDNTGESAYFIYPIHTSGCFMSSRSIASSLYLLVLRLMSRNYRDAYRLIESCVCDNVLTPQEKQIYDVIGTIKDDFHPDVHACRLKLYFVTYGCSDVMPYQFSVEKELLGYVTKIRNVSSYCKLSPDEEIFIINSISDKHGNAHISNRERIIKASFTLTFDSNSVKIYNRKFTPVYPKLTNITSNNNSNSSVDLDVLDTNKPIFKNLLSKLSIVRYSRPEAMTGPSAITYISEIMEDEKNLGFFFLYETLTDSLIFRILPDDSSHNIGSVLLRMFPDHYGSGMQGAILRVIEAHPEISSKMPIFEDKRKLKLPSLAGLDIYQTHIKNAATTVRTNIDDVNPSRMSMVIPSPYKPPVTVEAARTLQDDSKYYDGRSWLNPRITDFKRSKRIVSCQLIPLKLRKLASHYTSIEISHLVDLPLGAIDLSQYIEYKSLFARGEHPVSCESPLRVMLHPSSNSHIARSAVTRLEQDVIDFSNDENKGVLPVLKFIVTTSSSLNKTNLEGCVASMKSIMTALEKLREKDQMIIRNGIEELLNFCNSSTDATNGDIQAVAYSLQHRAGTEVPMVRKKYILLLEYQNILLLILKNFEQIFIIFCKSLIF